MEYVSLFSGIEAASVAWEPLGWTPRAFAEIEAFPSAVLKRHWPHVPNLGDITRMDWDAWRQDHGAPDVVVGGSPCVAFSLAGLRKGLDDPRGNLTLEYLRAVDRLEPLWFVWENVPGVLSDRTGAFGKLVEGAAKLGFVVDATVLDALDFGVPQRRQRVFLVGLHAQRALARGGKAGRLAGRAVVRWALESAISWLEPLDDLFAAVTGEVPGLGERLGWYGADWGTLCEAAGLEAAASDAAWGALFMSGLPGDRAAVLHEVLDRLGEGGALDSRVAAGLAGVATMRVVSVPHVPVKAGLADVLEDSPPSRFWLSAKACAGILRRAEGKRLPTGLRGLLEAQAAGKPLPAQGKAVVAMENQRKEMRLVGGEGTHAGTLAANVGAKGQNLVVLSSGQANATITTEHAPALTCLHEAPIVGFRWHASEGAGTLGDAEDVSPTLATAKPPAVAKRGGVRRITPLEAERLQGFPDGHTRIPWRDRPEEDCPDGPRYKACGNSMAVPVMRWIGERIAEVSSSSTPRLQPWGR